MGLRSKIFVTVTGVFIAFGVVTYAVFSNFILQQFDVLERARGEVNARRVLELFDSTVEDLKVKALDWAHWNETYDYIQNKNPSYAKTNLHYNSFAPFELVHVAYLDKNLAVKYGAKLDYSSESLIKLPSEELKAILDYKKVQEFISVPTEEPVGGMININGKPLFITISTIIDNDGLKPSNGFLIFTREFSDSLTQKFSNQTKLNITFVVKEENNIGSKSGMLVETEVAGPNELLSSGLVLDLDGSAIVKAQVRQNRDIFLKGLYSRDFLMTLMLAFMVIANIAILWIFERIVIKRMAVVAKKMNEITTTNDVSTRLQINGRDEIVSLAKTFNHLLMVIDSTYTELKAARLSAESANAAKSTFIAKVSHELRTPIHSIMGMQRIILKESKSNSIKHFVRLAQESSKGLMSTINEILDFTKVESGNLTLEKIPFNIREVARETMRLMSGRLEAKPDLQLLCDVHPDVPEQLEGDPTRIRQIMVNLIGNSIKFTAHGNVKLTIENQSPSGEWDGIRIAISDTGIGIPEDKLSSIFEPFKQADDSVTRNYQGTGLGLTIVKQLCEGMNGSISVTSILGIGSVFAAHLRLPSVPSPAYNIPVTIEPKKALIVAGALAWVENMTLAAGRFGVSCANIRLTEGGELPDLEESLSSAGLLVVSGEIFERGHDPESVIKLATERNIPLVAVLKPSEISLRERLINLGVKNLLTQPVFTDDIFLAASGQLKLDDQTWEDADEASLQLGKKLRILVADDAPTNRIILENMLKDAGHEVICVSDGMRMLKKVESCMTEGPERDHFDIVLTDVQMPLMDGITATKKIREFEKNTGKDYHIPIVAVTAHAMTEQHTDMQKAGVDGIVTKPIEPNALADIIARLTGKAAASPAPVAPAAPKALTEEGINQLADNLWESIKQAASGVSEIVETEMSLLGLKLGDVLDITDLYNRSGKSARRTGMILKAFAASYQPELDKLVGAEASKDLESMKKAAHTLKGLLLDIGSKSTGSVAGTIEAHCWAGRFEEGATLVPALQNQTLMVARLVEQLTSQLK